MDDDSLENGYDSSEGVAEEFEPRSFLDEWRSVLVSAIGIIFAQLSFLEDELELAAWRRFWLAIVTIGIFEFVPNFSLYLFREFVRGRAVVSLSQSLLVCSVADAGWKALVLAALICLGCYLSHGWILRLETHHNPYLIEHAQPLATIWLSRQVVFVFFYVIASIFAAKNIPVSPTLAQFVSVFSSVMGGGMVLYFYLIKSYALRIVHPGLSGMPLWVAVGIVFFCTDVVRMFVDATLTPTVVAGICVRLSQLLF